MPRNPLIHARIAINGLCYGEKALPSIAKCCKYTTQTAPVYGLIVVAFLTQNRKKHETDQHIHSFNLFHSRTLCG